MIIWKKYPEIENSYREKIINDIKEQGLDDGPWIVQEKIDGSNGSLVTDGKEVKMAKRTCLLDDDTEFNGIKKFRDENKYKILDLFDVCNQIFDDNIISVIIYGECFGGYYPHPDVENDNTIKKIQGRVYYSPKHEFMAYDIFCIGENDSFFVDYTDFLIITSKLDFPKIHARFVGSFEECLNYKNDFQTDIPEILGYPPIENNIMEGIIIKPYTYKKFRNGDRVILKSKNKKFSEKKEKKKKEKIELSEEANTIYNNISQYITENKLRSILSKFGEVTDKDFGKLLGTFVQDIIEDYNKDYEEIEIDKKERKIINKLVNKEAGNLIRENFLNIIDNNF